MGETLDGTVAILRCLAGNQALSTSEIYKDGLLVFRATPPQSCGVSMMEKGEEYQRW